MKPFVPTKEQERIIDESQCCVVIAKPGSGKTTVISKKISNIIPEIKEYQGVIAISYTNKASAQLKKYLDPELNKKNSFFGTIDKFYISEIIIPFGKQIFGVPEGDFTIIEFEDLPTLFSGKMGWFSRDFNYRDLKPNQIECLKDLFLDGKILIESIGLLANYIFNSSNSCRLYLKARYTHIFIDEYQDSGYEQHELFLKMQELGLCAFAVGDADQSIFGFSGKSSKYLLSLAKTPDKFKVLPLTYNHRSHISIVNYSMRLLLPNYPIEASNEIRVFEKQVTGSEYEIAIWLNSTIKKYCDLLSISNMNEVGVLVRKNQTGKIIDKNLKFKHKFFISTELDNDMSYWSMVFRRILHSLTDIKDNKLEAIEDFLDIDDDTQKIKKILKLLPRIETELNKNPRNIDNIVNSFIEIASLIYPKKRNERSISLLRTVVQSDELLNSFKPANNDEIQLMTLHKAKGLEFDLVFHLDLYEWILPHKSLNFNREPYYPDLEQDLNLHYVGITRARRVCILCTSTRRQNSRGSESRGVPSEFFYRNDLETFRKEIY
ncbi:MAG: UvrD-helicase domain-containing protein [Methanoregula sp.]